MRVVYFGSGEFGLPTLRSLIASRYGLCAVVSQPPRPAGRGGKVRRTPIHDAAEAAGIDVLTPDKPNTDDFARVLEELAPDLAVVVAYGHLIKKRLLAIPPRGFVNLHASLLPAYRGAAPVPWAILSGETVSGVSVFQLDERFDTGAVIGKFELPIAPTDTSASYLAKLAPPGAELMLRAVDAIASGTAVAQPQDGALASLAPKLAKEEGRIDWTMDFSVIERRVRAFQPWPHAFTVVTTAKGPQRLNVLELRPAETDAANAAPGTVLAADARNGLVVMAGDRPARLALLQPEGKKPMPDVDFLRGHSVVLG